MTSLDVFADRAGEQVLVGRAHFTRRHGRVSTTFLYDSDYLMTTGMSIDPTLPLVSGAQYQDGLVRSFADSAPDRWGRNLIEKAERAQAREEGRAPRRLDDLDYLLGVSDNARQGSLRYRLPGSESFLGDSSQVPKLVSLPHLLRASEELASDEEPASAVKQLLNTGTTGLGGARPKASVRLDNGGLAIAKFPHNSDRWDVMAWEATALDLLEQVGIDVPRRTLTRIGESSILILSRFDRTTAGDRIGYISALTALSANDGERRDYAEIAEAIRDLSFSARSDHHELFRRAVANVALGNTDDHLRNHGFLTQRGSWRICPAFDVNPNPDLWRARATSIMGADTFPDEAESLLALAEECSLSAEQAKAEMLRLCTTLTDWMNIASKNGVREREIAMMADAIRPRLEALSNAAMRSAF